MTTTRRRVFNPVLLAIVLAITFVGSITAIIHQQSRLTASEVPTTKVDFSRIDPSSPSHRVELETAHFLYVSPGDLVWENATSDGVHYYLDLNGTASRTQDAKHPITVAHYLLADSNGRVDTEGIPDIWIARTPCNLVGAVRQVTSEPGNGIALFGGHIWEAVNDLHSGCV
jgi:hypothetical protein